MYQFINSSNLNLNHVFGYVHTINHKHAFDRVCLKILQENVRGKIFFHDLRLHPYLNERFIIL